MAEGFFLHHCPAQMTACSAGSKPSGQVNPKAVSLMQECGIDLAGHVSTGLDDFSALFFYVAVTMGCGDVCPASSAAERREWSIPDPKNLDPEAFRRVRDEIESKVLALIQELGG